VLPQLATDVACKYFRDLSRDLVFLQTKELEISGGYYVDITEESWADVIELISQVEVTEELPQTPMAPAKPSGRPFSSALSGSVSC
jgi:hypothetical protein